MTGFFPAHIAGQLILYAGITALVFWLALQVGARRAGLDAAQSRRHAQLGVVVLLAWLALTTWISAQGVYRIRPGTALQPLLLGLLIPIAIGVLLLAFPNYRRVIDAIPQHWFAGHHALRAPFGIIFLAFYEMGELPGEFALSAGYGDITAAILGALAAYLVFTRYAYATAALVLWNVVGLADFLSVVPLGLTQVEPGGRIMDFYPFFLIPVYVVPLFFLFHVYSIRALLKKPKPPVMYA